MTVVEKLSSRVGM